MRALIIVDVQNDFMPGGALPAEEGDQVVPVINRLQPNYDLVVATQDRHPAGHESFASSHEGKNPGDTVELNGREQILWPDHCVQGSKGAEFHPELDTERIDEVFAKGSDPEIDSYSGFFDNDHRRATGLHAFLEKKGVEEVHVAGLATDYCVKFTVLDALELGYDTYVIRDACRGVNQKPGDADRALEEMGHDGAHIVFSEQVLEDKYKKVREKT